jgi:rhamnogalacturonan endolyase
VPAGAAERIAEATSESSVMKQKKFLVAPLALGVCFVACGEAGPNAGPGTGANPGASGSGGAVAVGGAMATVTAGTGGTGSGAAAGAGAGTAGSTSMAGGGTVNPTAGFAQLEDLNRGVVAVPSGNGNLVSWRLFGYEPSSIGFNVYRDGTKLNESPITDSTNYLDASGTGSSKYTVRALVDGAEKADSPVAGVWQDGYRSIATEPPAGGNNASGAYTYTSGDASVGDVDGDGQYEIIVKWDPSNAKDNSQKGYTGDVYLDAYPMEGQRLWRINLGPNIRAGAHYTQFLVYDLDGDGKAEVMLKTAPGTKDASGNYLKLGPAANDDDAEDYRNSDGYVLAGPEYVTVFSGETGLELATENFKIGRGDVSAWGDGYGGRVDRFLATIAFVEEGGRPSAIMGRGMYTRTTFTAWNYRDGKLTEAWTADHAANTAFGGKGAHSIDVANVDDDKMQEIVNGGATFDHDGKGMCSVSWSGHGDALHVGDLVPSRPGLEVFMPFEAASVPMYAMRDARTCDTIWKSPNDTPSGGEGPGRAVAADIDPMHEGAEAWTSGGTFMNGTTGQSISGSPSSVNFLIWWDGDLSRELLNGNRITQFDGEGQELTADGCSAINGSKSTPSLSGDLIGDWREEVVFRCGNTIRVYTTNQVTKSRIYTLMHDPQYRVAVSWQNVEYNQPPHPSFHIGQGMKAPPLPDIHVR